MVCSGPAPRFVPRAADDRIGYWELAYTQLGSPGGEGELSARTADRQERAWSVEQNTAQSACHLPSTPFFPGPAPSHLIGSAPLPAGARDAQVAAGEG